MRVTLAALAAVLVLQGVSTSQVIIREGAQGRDATETKKQEKKQEAMQEGRHAPIFYKAFYLANSSARNYKEAISLFELYLKKAPKAAHAPEAASRLVNALFRTGDTDRANELSDKYADLIAKAPTSRRNRGDAPRGGRGFGRGNRGGEMDRGRGERGGNNEERLARLETRIKDLQKSLRDAGEEGNKTRVSQIERQIASAKRRIENIKSGNAGGRRGREGRRGGRRGFGGNRTPLTEMSKDELAETVERMASRIERSADRMDEDRAEAMEKNFKKFKALIKDGKLKEAQELRGSIFGFRRRR